MLNFFRWFVIACLLLALLPATGMVAQEATPEPVIEVTTVPIPDDVVVIDTGEASPPVVVVREDDGFKARDWVLLGVIVVLVFLLRSDHATIRAALIEIGRSAPATLFEMGVSAIEAGIDQGDNYAKTTPTPMDDKGMEEIRAGFFNLEGEIRRLRNEATGGSVQQPEG